MTAPYQTPYYGAQGVQLFALNSLTSPSALITMSALMGLDNVGGQADDTNISNLDSPGFKEFVKGLIDPGSPGGDVVYNFQSTAHQFLETMQLQSAKATTQWFLAANDAATTVVPTITGTIASGNVQLIPPKGASSPKLSLRSGFFFYAYVKEFSKGVQTGQFIKAKLTLRASGAITPCVLGKLAPI